MPSSVGAFVLFADLSDCVPSTPSRSYLTHIRGLWEEQCGLLKRRGNVLKRGIRDRS